MPGHMLLCVRSLVPGGQCAAILLSDVGSRALCLEAPTVCLNSKPFGTAVLLAV